MEYKDKRNLIFLIWMAAFIFLTVSVIFLSAAAIPIVIITLICITICTSIIQGGINTASLEQQDQYSKRKREDQFNELLNRLSDDDIAYLKERIDHQEGVSMHDLLSNDGELRS